MRGFQNPPFHSFRLYLQAPDTGTHRAKRWIIGGAVVAVVAYFVWGILPEPAFNQAALKGMTPKQIKAYFGRPDFKFSQLGEPVFVYYKPYSWCGLSYSLYFRHGHVVKVASGSH